MIMIVVSGWQHQQQKKLSANIFASRFMRKEFYEEIMEKFLSYGVEFMSYAGDSE